MTPKSGVLLLLACVTAIASVGSVFELSSGMPQLGQTNTAIILTISIPLTIVLFILAVMDARANLK
ncbi:hypothetical protein [Geminocystis sp.]|jgi:hypothetical protein|uniref:hypothetical protein n=1 Tax=Geminocystis sp. TaxID=2664100 RepID=UPI003593B3E0